MGDIEQGNCQTCGKEGPMTRTYWYYDIKCECHSPEHFEIVWHCHDCQPIEPTKTTVSKKPTRHRTN